MLRTTSIPGEVFGVPPTVSSLDLQSDSTTDSAIDFQYYAVNNTANGGIDEFWGKSLLSRTSTHVQGEAGIISGDNPSLLVVSYPAARTVSTQARENSMEELSLDSELDEPVVLHTLPRTMSETSTSYETMVAPPPCKKIRLTSAPASLALSSDEPRLHLGETGRSRLKSLISNLTKVNPELRERVAEIGKVKLASIPQLLMMARTCGVWDEVLQIAESFPSRK